MSSEEEKIAAEVKAAETALQADLAKATGMVKTHMVWLAGGVGALAGFILGRVV
jgi:hypothetical protein